MLRGATKAKLSEDGSENQISVSKLPKCHLLVPLTFGLQPNKKHAFAGETVFFEHHRLTASRTGCISAFRRVVTLLLQQILLRSVTWITPHPRPCFPISPPRLHA